MFSFGIYIYIYIFSLTIPTVILSTTVPPSKPVSRIPSSVTTGSNALLTCVDNDASPPPTYKWYKDNTPLPDDPSKFPSFKNLTYKMNVFNGNLVSVDLQYLKIQNIIYNECLSIHLFFNAEVSLFL